MKRFFCIAITVIAVVGAAYALLPRIIPNGEDLLVYGDGDDPGA